MSSAVRVTNHQVNGQANFTRAAPMFHYEQDHRMHMLLVAVDYENTGRPLTCTTDARNVEELAKYCRMQTLVALYSEQCIKEDVLAAIRQIGSKCGPDDYFVFYFAGHGTNLADALGDEGKSQEEAFVFVNRKGQVSSDTLLSDEELCCEIISSLPVEARILIIADCCHSTPIVNLNRTRWEGRHVICITGCQFESVSGGILTHSMLLAIDKLSKVGRDNYSVGMLFNAALHEDELVFGSKQDLHIQTSPNFSTCAMAWPLVPPVGYQAPLSRCAAAGSIRSRAAEEWISPELLQYVTPEALNAPVSVEEYISYVQGGGAMFKPCRACSAGCSSGQCSIQ